MCAGVHVFEDVGIRESSGHTGLESWVRRDNTEEDYLLGKAGGARGLRDGISAHLAGLSPFRCHFFHSQLTCPDDHAA